MTDLIRALAGKVELRRDGRYLRGLCPIHQEKTPSFTVFPDGGYHCFGCGAHGHVSEFTGEKRAKIATHLHEKPKTWPKLDWAVFTLPMQQNDAQKALCTARGYSARFVKWLCDAGFIGSYEGQWAFPIRHRGEIVRAHVRCASGKRWFYVPNEGCPVDAFVIRNGENVVHLCESQWDSLAIMNQLGISGIFIATRGACNAGKIGPLRLPKHVRYYAWPQNDEAGERWLRDVNQYTPAPTTVIRMPDGVKDANDFTRAGGCLKELLK